MRLKRKTTIWKKQLGEKIYKNIRHSKILNSGIYLVRTDYSRQLMVENMVKKENQKNFFIKTFIQKFKQPLVLDAAGQLQLLYELSSNSPNILDMVIYPIYFPSISLESNNCKSSV